MDFDKDGREDLLACSVPDGGIHVFRSAGAGTFQAPLAFEGVDGKPIRLGWNTMASAYDWDGDGNLDLLVRRGGRIHLMINQGGRNKPVFGEPQALTDGVVTIQGRMPFMADWDGDGRDDLLLPSQRGILLYRNTGEKGRPVLEHPAVLIPATPYNQGQRRADEPPRLPEGPSFYNTVCAFDFNGDGRLDLLVGDHWCENIERLAAPEGPGYARYGRVWLYERLPSGDGQR